MRDIYNYETPSAIDVVEFLMKGGKRPEAERVIMLIEQIKYQQGRLEAYILEDNPPIIEEVR